MNIKEIKHSDDITDLHMLWVKFVEEIDEYLVINSIAENYRSILENQADRWVKEDEMVVFGCFNPTLKGFVAAKENTGNSLFTASTVIYINAIYLEPE